MLYDHFEAFALNVCAREFKVALAMAIKYWKETISMYLLLKDDEDLL